MTKEMKVRVQGRESKNSFGEGWKRKRVGEDKKMEYDF